jgi:hypothetical protein
VKVSVYVEGPSDQKALQALLKPIIDEGRSRRIGISFFPLNGKAKILDDVPRKAAEQLHLNTESWIFALPDLCLKHDLEALLLAAPAVLRDRLKTTDALLGWRRPVEDQNDDKPPKRIVEDLFRKYRRKGEYVDTVDAVWILERANLEDVVTACQQHFAPFVRELRALAEGRDPDEPQAAGNQRSKVAVNATAP